jgi:hypothetical protein
MQTRTRLRIVEKLLCIGLLLGLVVGSACRTSTPATASDEGPLTHPGLEWLTHADPVHDCTAAWERGDHRFIGVYGFAPYTPGVPKSATEIVKANGVRYLEGTSDAITSPEHGRAVAKATDYARRYNTGLLEKLENAK